MTSIEGKREKLNNPLVIAVIVFLSIPPATATTLILYKLMH